MKKDIDRLYEINYTYDKPVEYHSISYLGKLDKYATQSKNMEEVGVYKKTSKPYEEPLNIYPATMDKYFEFHTYVNCLLLDRSSSKDINVISMSYLDYLIYLIELYDENSYIYMYMLYGIADICLGITVEDIKDNKFYWTKDKKGKNELIINGNTYTRKDFNNIIDIICSQNLIDREDENIDPKFKKAMDDALAFKNKNLKKMGTLEDQIICVLISSSLTLDVINSLTIRKFSKILQRIDYKLHYEIYKSAELSGMVTFKKDIDHWMTEIKYDKYADLMVDFNKTHDKIMGNKQG